MTARATFEARCHAALSRYKTAVAEGTYRVAADNTLVDALLKAADVYACSAEATLRAAIAASDTPLNIMLRRQALKADRTATG